MFFLHLFLLLVSTVFTARADNKTAGPILEAMEHVSTHTTELGSIIGTWDGRMIPNPLKAVVVQTKAIELMSALNSGLKTAERSEILDIHETLSIKDATENMIAAINATMETTIEAKPRLERHWGSVQIVRLNLHLQRGASRAFGSAVVAKLDSFARDEGAKSVAAIDAAFQQALRVYG